MSGLDSGAVELGGAPVDGAAAAVVLVHGRGGTARGMLDLAPELVPAEVMSRVAWIAPRAPGETAAGGTWYPASFMAPRSTNEPWLGASLEALGSVLGELKARGVPERSILLAGFSQGACLALELAARRGRPLGAVAAWTGGLIGEALRPAELAGDLGGMPVFLGAGDPDPHVPWRRVEESAAIFEDLGAAVTLERYPGMPHTVNDREITWARQRIERLVAAGVESPA